MFVYRPELLLMGADGSMVGYADIPQVALAFGSAVMGVIALGGAVTGHFFWGPLATWNRIVAAPAAVLLLMPGDYQLLLNTIGAVLFMVSLVVNFVRHRRPNPAVT